MSTGGGSKKADKATVMTPAASTLALTSIQQGSDSTGKKEQLNDGVFLVWTSILSYRHRKYDTFSSMYRIVSVSYQYRKSKLGKYQYWYRNFRYQSINISITFPQSKSQV